FALSVTEPEMQRFMEAYGEKLRRTICDTEYPHVISLSGRQRYELMTEYEKTKILDVNQKVVHYKIMLGKLLHYIMLSPELSSIEALPNLFLEKINEFHTTENIAQGVPALVRLTNYSPAQLGRLMKKYLGMTPHKYVFTMRMNMAYSLVSNSSLSIEAISERVGYASFSHFNQAFKRKYKITPSKLRKRLDVRTV
ncbi:MAG: helix-turn-helix transcriptional regulator, partial [Eubacteriales bacterium]|nr:helix-turn-helix transcriptional regulator [Eubacteriales bacterium]